jgi:hypothetical protein
MNTVAQTPQAIQSAVKECFALCFGGGAPVDEIGRYCSELRDMGWDETDILNVEVTVRRMLVRVIEDKIPEDDAE